jgi:hypothetical protein
MHARVAAAKTLRPQSAGDRRLPGFAAIRVHIKAGQRDPRVSYLTLVPKVDGAAPNRIAGTAFCPHRLHG